MTLLIASVLLAVLTAGYVIGPVVARRESPIADLAPGAVLDADARRRVALASLKELDYDYLGGKLDEPDYRAQRTRLSQEALVALRAAEAVRAEAGLESGDEAVRGADRHACGFLNPAASRFCAGCGVRLA